VAQKPVAAQAVASKPVTKVVEPVVASKAVTHVQSAPVAAKNSSIAQVKKLVVHPVAKKVIHT